MTGGNPNPNQPPGATGSPSTAVSEAHDIALEALFKVIQLERARLGDPPGSSIDRRLQDLVANGARLPGGSSVEDVNQRLRFRKRLMQELSAILVGLDPDPRVPRLPGPN